MQNEEDVDEWNLGISVASQTQSDLHEASETSERAAAVALPSSDDWDGEKAIQHQGPTGAGPAMYQPMAMHEQRSANVGAMAPHDGVGGLHMGTSRLPVGARELHVGAGGLHVGAMELPVGERAALGGESDTGLVDPF